ncbi:peptidoglycan recognition protein family protein [Hominifimenecus sp. rT4P-3]|uniref:peptidoglycan recognition protein family protein n=1 Tax=Hominifimenecus sp. rT4P-3 TaxID=3242979 RepID=UPI003DA4801F
MNRKVWRNESAKGTGASYEKHWERRLAGRRKRKKQAKQIQIIGCAGILSFFFFLGFVTGKGCSGAAARVQAAEATERKEEHIKENEEPIAVKMGQTLKLPEYVDEQYLTVNPYSRPGKATGEIHAVVIHYVGNPGTTAQQNRDYFEDIASGEEDVYMSSNFVIGLEGEVIACVPPGEVAYASNNRNSDTISIENCHPDETGKFNDSTYQSLVKLTAWLCRQYQLDPLNGGVIRHHDVTGKCCPKYFVEHEDSWKQFLQDVDDWMKQ